MSPEKEVDIGAQEHANVLKQYNLYDNPALQEYVQNVGTRIIRNTERADVRYKFYLLDSPVINAFALPGGYIYITRGIMALSNSEAELASVLAHEAGHITARHAAERYSRNVVTTVGAAVLSAVIGDDGISKVLGLGNDLYIKSYSRGQESQADSLGIRYLDRAGYDPRAMSGFLRSMQMDTQLEEALKGKNAVGGTDFFSTHPATAERVAQATQEAQNYPVHGEVSRDAYLRRLEGLTYGDGADQGFERSGNFYHPQMGFTFAIPKDFEVINQPSQLVMQGKGKAVAVFDMVPNKHKLAPMDFLKMVWVEGEDVEHEEEITINGMKAATSTFEGLLNGEQVTIRLISVAWDKDNVARFMLAMPRNVSKDILADLQRTTYSLRRMSAVERETITPYRIHIVLAKAGDTAQSLARQMAVKDSPLERFRTLNGLGAGEDVRAGKLYKIVVN